MSNLFHIYVISMPNALERRQLISNMLENSNFSWTFFDGLSGEYTNEVLGELKIDTERQIYHFGRPLTLTELGCFKSHYSVMQKHLDSNRVKWAMILEDDVILDTNYDFDSVIDYCNNHQLNYIRLFSKTLQQFKEVGMLSQFRQILRFKTDPYGAQAYLINSVGIKKFLNSCKSIDVPIDDELGRFWIHKLPPYAVYPYPVIERFIPSQLSSERDESNKSRLKFSYKIFTRRIIEKIKKTSFNFFYIEK